MGLNLSPDDKRVALDVINIGGEREIWVMDLDRGVASRFTLSSSVEIFPVWSPDGSRIAFGSSPGLGRADLYQRSANGVGKAEPLLEDETRKTPNDWSRDGRFLLYGVTGALWRGDKGLLPKTELWALPLAAEGDRKPFPVVKMPFNAAAGSFSPDGRWIAYVSDESGRPDVYAQSFPALAAKFRISTEGGVQPRWRGDGKEIFYLAPDGRLMAAAVKGESTLEVAAPSPLFKTETALMDDSVEAIQYAVASDGRRFLFSTPVQSATSQPITVVLDWSADLRKR
jgi:Tol biopolymer transport system component